MIFLLMLCFVGDPPCRDCGVAPASDADAIAQYDGLARAVEALQGQVFQLAQEKNSPSWSSTTLKEDLQEAVIDLSDTMADNAFLSRSYLALAVAELKLMQASVRVNKMTLSERTKVLRHVEAIQLAIDDRTLDGPDLRVFRVLTAGVRQELRKESSRLHPYSSQPSVDPIVYSAPMHVEQSIPCFTRGQQLLRQSSSTCGIFPYPCNQARVSQSYSFNRYDHCKMGLRSFRIP